MSELPHLERKLHTCQVILWLKRSFEHTGGVGGGGGGNGGDGADGESEADSESLMISKEALYQSYVAMCNESDTRPLFSRPVVGKMVKRAFPTIQTRRRGPRTNVKQHWIGLRQVDDDDATNADEPGANHDHPSDKVQSSPRSSLSSQSTSSSATPGGSPAEPTTSTATTSASASTPAQPASPDRASSVAALIEADQRHPGGSQRTTPTRNPLPSPQHWAYDHNGTPQPQQQPQHQSGPQHGVPEDGHNYHQMRWQQEQRLEGGQMQRDMSFDHHHQQQQLYHHQQQQQQQHQQHYLHQHYARPQPQQAQYQHHSPLPYPQLHQPQPQHEQQHEQQRQRQHQLQQHFDRLPFYEFQMERPPPSAESTLDDFLRHFQSSSSSPPPSSSSSSHPQPHVPDHRNPPAQQQQQAAPTHQHQRQRPHEQQNQFDLRHQLRPPPLKPMTTIKLERDGIVSDDGLRMAADEVYKWAAQMIGSRGQPPATTQQSSSPPSGAREEAARVTQ